MNILYFLNKAYIVIISLNFYFLSDIYLIWLTIVFDMISLKCWNSCQRVCEFPTFFSISPHLGVDLGLRWSQGVYNLSYTKKKVFFLKTNIHNLVEVGLICKNRNVYFFIFYFLQKAESYIIQYKQWGKDMNYIKFYFSYVSLPTHHLDLC